MWVILEQNKAMLLTLVFIGPKFYHCLALKLTHIGRLCNCCLDLIDNDANSKILMFAAFEFCVVENMIAELLLSVEQQVDNSIFTVLWKNWIFQVKA